MAVLRGVFSPIVFGAVVLAYYFALRQHFRFVDLLFVLGFVVINYFSQRKTDDELHVRLLQLEIRKEKAEERAQQNLVS